MPKRGHAAAEQSPAKRSKPAPPSDDESPEEPDEAQPPRSDDDDAAPAHSVCLEAPDGGALSRADVVDALRDVGGAHCDGIAVAQRTPLAADAAAELGRAHARVLDLRNCAMDADGWSAFAETLSSNPHVAAVRTSEELEGVAAARRARGLEELVVTAEDSASDDDEGSDSSVEEGVYVRRADVPRTSRGGAAAATWIFRVETSAETEASLGRKGPALDSAAAATWVFRVETSAETEASLGRTGPALDSAAAATWIFRGETSAATPRRSDARGRKRHYGPGSRLRPRPTSGRLVETGTHIRYCDNEECGRLLAGETVVLTDGARDFCEACAPSDVSGFRRETARDRFANAVLEVISS